MKKIFIGAMLLLMAAIVYGVATQSYGRKTIDGRPSIIQKCTVVTDCNSAAGPCDDQTLTTTRTIYGYIQRVVILHTATVAAFQVYVDDSDGVSIFDKDDCAGTDDDYSYVTELEGIPVASALTVGIVDANADGGVADANTTALSVVIYYTEQPQ